MSQNAIYNQGIISLSCSKVGIGPFGTISMAVRVSLVDSRGHISFDSFIAPISPVTNYNTMITGITEADMSEGEALPLDMVQMCVARLVDGKILVGPQLIADLNALGIQHPPSQTRDMSAYHAQYPIASANTITWSPVTNSTCKRCLNGQQHNIEMARLAMDIYRATQVHWDSVMKIEPPNRPAGAL